MSWNRRYSQLNDALADLAYSHQSITRLAEDAGLSPSRINYGGNASEIWHSVISELDKEGQVDQLFNVAKAKYPQNPFIIAATSSNEINYSIAPLIDDVSEWKEPNYSELEVLTLERSTLLPITFLEKGMTMASSVAKVLVKTGASTQVGTGFLCRFPDSEKTVFITNYHVISEKNKARYTNIIFNYEETVDGGSKMTETFKINTDGLWLTSPVHQLDVTIFELEDPDDTLSNYGFIQLFENETAKNEFVNIIQHPGGQSKQLALYHNVVTSTNERVVQYLTDTLKGSSGAPVFNSDWTVVAIHHSGGLIKAGEDPLPFNFKSRNEGIQISAIINFFASSNQN